MEPLPGKWQNSEEIGHISFTCGYCGEKTGVTVGYTDPDGRGRIFLCGGCNRPTFIEYKGSIYLQTPSPTLGNIVLHLPQEIDSLYLESRHCTQVEAYTACVLVCRKILMHVAVGKGAEPGQNFLDYVIYLTEKGYVPPDGKGWVDHIRKKGNEANHEIVIMSKEIALELLSFVEMLLKFVYELPARIMPPSTGTPS